MNTTDHQRTTISPRMFLFLLLAIIAACLWLNVYVRDFQLDDAGITWRYVWNITHGLGWVYNPGEHINASTSPLRTLLLVILTLVLTDIPRASLFLDLSSLIGATVVLAFWLHRRGQTLIGLVAAALLATHPLFSFSLGVETSLVLLLTGATLWAYDAGHYHRAAIALALLVLTRNDGVLLGVCLGAYHLWRWRRGDVRMVPWTVFPLMGIIVAPWFAFSWHTFGSPLPNTLAAKTAQGRSGFFPLFGVGWVMDIDLFGTARSIFLALFLAPIGARFALYWRMGFLFPAVAFGGLHFIAYTGMGVAAYPWYYAPILYAIFILIGCGVEAIATVLRTIRYRNAPLFISPDVASVPIGLSLAIISAVLLWAQIVTNADDTLALDRIARRYDNSANYAAIAAYLREEAAPGSTVAASEIGLIGWDSGLPIVDYLGLLSPETATRVSAGDVASWVETFAPDYIVTHEPAWPIEQPSRATVSFQSEYAPIVSFRKDAGRGVTIWQRHSTGAKSSSEQP